MDNKNLFAWMMILFNCYGVPSFMQGQVKTVSFWVLLPAMLSLSSTLLRASFWVLIS